LSFGSPAEWARQRAEGHPLVQELLAKPCIVLARTSMLEEELNKFS